MLLLTRLLWRDSDLFMCALVMQTAAWLCCDGCRYCVPGKPGEGSVMVMDDVMLSLFHSLT